MKQDRGSNEQLELRKSITLSQKEKSTHIPKSFGKGSNVTQ